MGVLEGKAMAYRSPKLIAWRAQLPLSLFVSAINADDPYPLAYLQRVKAQALAICAYPSFHLLLWGLPLLLIGHLSVSDTGEPTFRALIGQQAAVPGPSRFVAASSPTPEATATPTLLATAPSPTATASLIVVTAATLLPGSTGTSTPRLTITPSPLPPTSTLSPTPSPTPTLILTAPPSSATPTPTPSASAQGDSDFDGIKDRVECPLLLTCPDHDGDGFADYRDIDSDGDGIVDRVEAVVVIIHGEHLRPVDLDGDGVADYLDADSDNDSLPDYNEGYDGNLDGFPDTVALGRDIDADGLDDAFDTIQSGHSLINAMGFNAPLPRSSQGLPNWRNADDDGDGIPTIEEIGRNRSLPVDEDGDGTPDYLQSKAERYLFLPFILRAPLYQE